MMADPAPIPAPLAVPQLIAATLASDVFGPVMDLSRLAGGWGALAAALGAVVLVLLPVLVDWQRRRNLWRTAPERLVDDAPELPGPRAAGVLLAAVAGTLALAGESHWQDPLTAWIAAVAAFTATHLRWSGALALLAFALLAAGITCAAQAWLPGFGLNTAFALALSALYFLWLSRFWDQQLLPRPDPTAATTVGRDGQSWTTTGRLVGIARRAAYLCLFLAAALLLSQLIRPRAPAAVVGATLTVLLFLIAALRLSGSPRRRDGTLASAAAVSALACAGLSLWIGMATRS